MSFDQPTDAPDLKEFTDGREEQRDAMLNEGDGRKQATEADVERCLHWMSSNLANLSQAIANRQHTEQWIKVVEAQEKAKNAGEAANRQETLARSSVAYIEALEGYRDASAEEQRLRYSWQLCNTVIDVFRTKCANERRVV